MQSMQLEDEAQNDFVKSYKCRSKMITAEERKGSFQTMIAKPPVVMSMEAQASE
jgi:hypothetical protein